MSRLGLWSGLWTAVAVLGFVIGIVVTALVFPGPRWTGDAAAFAAAFENPLAWSVGEAFSLLIIPGWLGLSCAIHVTAAPDRRVWSIAALVLTAAYVATIGANDLAQITTVRLNLMEGTTRALELWIKDNPRSFFYPLEALGYAWQTFAAGLAGLALGASRLERWVRRLFAATAISGVMGIVGVLLGLDFLHPWIVAGNALYTVSFAGGALLCAVRFGRFGGVR